MLVGICDFPSNYTFPPRGYGGIERWLWAAALGARQAGAEVHLIGPAWLPELQPEWTVRPYRLEDLPQRSRNLTKLRTTPYDLLIVGHEYPSLPAWRAIANELNCDVATFQHNPHFRHQTHAFEGHRYRLYCYSTEMTERYRHDRPIQTLSVQIGLNEFEPAATPGDDLVWVGRVDAQKSPHLAVMAARMLGRKIRIVGPVFDTEYFRRHQNLFCAEHVELVGVLGGAAKTAAFATASTFVYTCGRTYVEAGVATLGESLRAGTPVAALTWRHGTCAHAALCERTGVVATVDPTLTDNDAALALATAISDTDRLLPKNVQEVGLDRFDLRKHFLTLAARP